MLDRVGESRDSAKGCSYCCGSSCFVGALAVRLNVVACVQLPLLAPCSLEFSSMPRVSRRVLGFRGGGVHFSPLDVLVFPLPFDVVLDFISNFGE